MGPVALVAFLGALVLAMGSVGCNEHVGRDGDSWYDADVKADASNDADVEVDDGDTAVETDVDIETAIDAEADADVEANVEDDSFYYVCGDAGECNAGVGSGWGTGIDTTVDDQGRSREMPFKSIDYAVSTKSGVGAGNTILIGDGVYTQRNEATHDGSVVETQISGTSESWITIRAENVHKAIIDGEHAIPTVLKTNSSSYLRFEYLDIQRGSGYVVRLMFGSHNIYFEGCKIHSTNAEDSWLYVSLFTVQQQDDVSPGHDITIDNCEFYDWGNHGPIVENGNERARGHAIYHHGYNVVIESSTFRNPRAFAGTAIKFDEGSNLGDVALVVEDNVFDLNNIQYGLWVDYGIDGDVYVMNNVFRDVGVVLSWPSGMNRAQGYISDNRYEPGLIFLEERGGEPPGVWSVYENNDEL